MSADVAAQALQAFYSTKPNGSGLGLAIVKRAARIIGARLEVDSKLDSGTRFTVHIPLRGGFN